MQERWRSRLEDVEAAAQAKLDRARDLISQYEDTITELSQDSSSLTASAQALRDDNSALSASLETARAEAEHQQVSLFDLLQVPSRRGYLQAHRLYSNLTTSPIYWRPGHPSRLKRFYYSPGNARAVLLCRSSILCQLIHCTVAGGERMTSLNNMVVWHGLFCSIAAIMRRSAWRQ